MPDEKTVQITTTTNLPVYNYQNDRWSTIKDRMHFYFLANGIAQDQMKKAIFLSNCDLNTIELIASLAIPLQLTDDNITFEKIVKLLDKQFDEGKNILPSTYTFFNTKQKAGQNASEYMAELLEKVRFCGFDSDKWKDKSMERALRDQLVMGVNDQKAVQELLKQSDPSLEEALKIVKNIENLRKDVKTIDPQHQANLQKVKQMHQRYQKQSKPPADSKNTNFKQKKNWELEVPCVCCNRNNHCRKDCRLKNTAVCEHCHRAGHLVQACWKKKKEEGSLSSVNRNNSNKTKNNRISCNTMSTKLHSTPSLHLKINKSKTPMEADSGAERTCFGETDWILMGRPKLKPAKVKLTLYNGYELKVKGECEVLADASEVPTLQATQPQRLPALVVEGNRKALLGIDWIKNLKISMDALIFNQSPKKVPEVKPEVPSIFKVMEDEYQRRLQPLLNEFQDIFEGLGHCTKLKANIQLQEGAQPKFFKPRPIPFALLPKVKAEIQREVDLGILKPITVSEWAAPIVPAPKPNGEVRVCGDFKTTINPQTKVDQYPIPLINEILTKLNGGKYFTKIDLKDAYLQIELTEESKKLCVINTPWGLFQCQKLPFGVCPAPAIFQRLAEQMIAGIDHVAVYLDDLIITGRTLEEHLENLRKVFQRIREFGLRINLAKSKFFQPEVEYLGYIINENGRIADPKRVEAIKNCPRPKNLKEVESFIGQINYYGPFIENFSTLCEPLNELRRKDRPFKWTQAQEKAFEALKNRLAEKTLLMHYDDQLPLILSTDASEYGIGAVLLQKHPDGTEKPLAFASKTLSTTERGYSQIEKEAYAIIFGTVKFNQYLAYRRFTLYTDHQPLLAIFDPKKAIPIYTMKRLQRWAIHLMSYNFDIRFKPTDKHLNADALSRLPAGTDFEFEEKEAQENTMISRLYEDSTFAEFPVLASEIREETQKCPELHQIYKFVEESNWPRIHQAEDPKLYNYQTVKKQLSIQNGLIFRGDQIVIPVTLRERMLKSLHSVHIGSKKMILNARNLCWWPRMRQQIEENAQSCQQCQEYAPKPRPEFSPWPEPETIWERLHIDFAEWQGRKFFLIIDAKSKYPIIIPMKVTTASDVIRILELIFTDFGIPITIVSDNGPPFGSENLKMFFQRYGIKHVKTPPYHPASNSQVERLVRSMKEAFEKTKHLPPKQQLQEFLRSYRFTTHTMTGKKPAEMMFGRPPRSALDLAKPHPSQDPSSKYALHEPVWAKDPSSKHRWLPGIVSKVVGNMVYWVKLQNGETHKRHQNQIRPKNASKIPTDEDLLVDLLPIIPEEAPPAPAPAEPDHPDDNDNEDPNPEEQPRKTYPKRNRRRAQTWDPAKRRYVDIGSTF
uniref:RNA-directed DNA polymerase n=1 Tax=Acrobeloides nanus TaxID=290746 RepID=A0A914DXM4_9BILA